RQHRAAVAHPLREDALRTPAHRFECLPGYPWTGHFLSDLPALAGLRLHYLDEGPVQAERTYLCLHGSPGWSYLYRKMIAELLAAGQRVVAPDLIGFGKSDKPKRAQAHRFGWHRQVLLELIERLDLQHIVLVGHDWGGLLGLTLPMAAAQRYAGLLLMNTALTTGETPVPPGLDAWAQMCQRQPGFDIAGLVASDNPQLSAQECAAYMAPFPDQGHRAAIGAFAAMLPRGPDDDGAALARAAREFFYSRWTAPSFMAIGEQDPVLGVAPMEALHAMLPGCPAPLYLAQSGQLVPEHGQQVVLAALRHFAQV
ncbi:MAG: haloalkane dehalogenase, partial [Rhodoferax sp.]